MEEGLAEIRRRLGVSPEAALTLTTFPPPPSLWQRARAVLAADALAATSLRDARAALTRVGAGALAEMLIDEAGAAGDAVLRAPLLCLAGQHGGS